MRRTSRRRNRNIEEAAERRPVLWLMTFSDFVTLLLTFFVLLVAMSSVDKKRLQNAFRYFESSGGAGMVRRTQSPPSPPSPGDLAFQALRGDMEGLYSGRVQDFDKLSSSSALTRGADAGNFIWVRKDPASDAFSVILGSELLFEPESARLLPAALPALKKLGNFANKSDYTMLIDVHTRGTHTGNGVDSTGEALSAGQAQALLSYLLVQCGVDPKRLALGAYGGSQPLSDAADRGAAGVVDARA